MSFFKKLKNKLFKSSSKLDEGLDAIVADGGVEEEVAAGGVEDAPQDTGQITTDAEAAESARQLEAIEEAKQQAEAARLARAEANRAAEEAAEAARKALAQADAQIAKRAAEQAAEAAAETRRVEEERIEQEKAKAEAARREADRRKQARLEEARLQEERLSIERAEAARAAEEERKAQEASEAAKAAAAQAAEEAAQQAQEAERRAQAEKAQQAEKEAAAANEARIAREAAEAAEAAAKAAAEAAAKADAEAAALADAHSAREVEQAREQAKANVVSALDAPRAAAALAEDANDAEAPVKKPGLIGRFLGRGDTKTVMRRELDDDMLEALEELLISADMGVDTALRVTANMAEGRFGKKLSTQEIKDLLATEIATIMDPVAKPMPLYPKRPQVVLVVGVNGSGKTTTIGKLALQFSNAGKKVVIAAGDTFRAAAVEQLQVWGDRAGVPVLTAPEGSDPASLAFDAMTKAEADGADLLLIDTAGRLQNRADLMEELAKIVRVIRKKDDTAPHNTLLVLDATTGQNALNQVEIFRNISDVSGLVMTKLDGTAKGGVLVALADKFGLPIHAIGVGEQIDDLDAFDPMEFAQALTGASTG